MSSLRKQPILLVCLWRHDGHVCGQEQKHFSPQGTKLYFHGNSLRKNSIVLTLNMAALSRGCKPRISQLLFLARHRHCLGIGSQLDNAANLFFLLLFIMKLYHVHLAPDFLPCLHFMITLSYNIRFLMIDEMSQSKLVNHWKVRNFPSGDNCRQIRIQDTLGGQWWLSIFTRRI